MQVCQNLTDKIFYILSKNNIGKGSKCIGDIHYGILSVAKRDIVMVEPLCDTSRSIIIFDNGNVEAVIENKIINQQMLVKVILDILELDDKQ